MSVSLRDDDTILSRPDETRPRQSRNRRRPWLWIALLVVVLAAGGAAAAVLLGGDADTTADGQPATTLTTANVEQRDVVQTDELEGTLRFGDTVAITAGRAGTLTGVAQPGENVGRGEELLRVDADAVVLLYGDATPYRTLQEGLAGDDVEQLEANLERLGFDAGGSLTVDGTFDSATAAAVQAWQTDLGVAADGVVEPADYRMAAGPLQITRALVTTGASVNPEATVLEAAALSRVGVVVSPNAGAAEDLPEVGTAIAQGQVLLEVGDVPLPALLGDEEFGRDLSDGSEGDDVARLEQALAALGFDADGDLVVDEEYDDATRQALLDWENELGITEDGVFQPAQALVVPESSTVTQVLVAAEDQVRAGQPVLEIGGSTRRVQAELPVDNTLALAVGEAVQVELPDGSVAPGTITSIGVVAITPVDDGDPYVEVEIALGETDSAAAANLTETPVDVLVAGETAAGVLAVPTSALVALQGGGYAVEVVEGTGTRLVSVEPGLFADGFVEITGDVQAGASVAVPQ